MERRVSDKDLERLERQIDKTYRAELKIIKKEIESYFAPYQADDEARRAKVEAGEMTKEEYRIWRLNTFCTGKKYEQFCEMLARQMRETNQIAMQEINDMRAAAYADGFNFATYQVDTKINGVK